MQVTVVVAGVASVALAVAAPAAASGPVGPLSPAPLRAGAEPLDLPHAVTPVAAYGGRLAWSRLDRATGRYRLVTRAGGVTREVPVAPRGVPFDVDLGPDERGRVVAAYSRCDREPPAGGAFVEFPKWADGRGCRLYRFDFATGRETPIAAANAPGASQFLPSIWRARVAFARVYPRRPGMRGRLPYLYVRALSGGGRSRRLPGGPRGVISVGGSAELVGQPTGMDLYGRRLAFGWAYRARFSNTPTEIRLDTVGGGGAVLERVLDASEITGDDFTAPAVAGGRVFYARTLYGDTTRSSYRRYDIRSRRFAAAPAPPVLLALARVRDGTTAQLRAGNYNWCELEDTEPGVSPCVIEFADRIPFAPARRILEGDRSARR
jgi:hypothetical protein